MYRKDSEGWLKHADFIVLDLLCLQISFILAYVLSGYGWNPYHIMLYRNMSIFLELADLLVIFCYDTMKGVLKKGYYRDFVVTLKHSIMVGGLGNFISVSASAGWRLFETGIISYYFIVYRDYLFCARTQKKISEKTDAERRRAVFTDHNIRRSGKTSR